MQEGGRQKSKEPEKHQKKWFWNKDDVASAVLKDSRVSADALNKFQQKFGFGLGFFFFLSIFSLKILLAEGSGFIFIFIFYISLFGKRK